MADWGGQGMAWIAWRGEIEASTTSHSCGASECCFDFRLMYSAHLTPSQLKILQAGWIREGTWPKGAIAPDSDDAPEAQLPETTESAATTSSVPTPRPDEVHSRLFI